MNHLWIYGAGGHGKGVAECGTSCGLELRGFIDDAPRAAACLGAPVRTWADWQALAPLRVALGIGDNAARQAVTERLLGAPCNLVTLVHASATVSPSATLETGVVVMPGAVINAQAHVQRGAIINSGAVVEHDCTVGAFAHISCNATLGGGVQVGELSLVGLGASVLPGLQVGTRCTVGAGAVVTRHVASGLCVRGVPARV